MKKKIIALSAMLLSVILASFIIAGLFTMQNNNNYTNSDNSDKNDSINIISSFYPMYIISLNITDGVDGVEVSNLTPNQTGCLHDYQFTTSDMKKLEDADILVTNGGGMETFITDVAKQYPDLEIIDSSNGIEFLAEDEDEVNAHAWLNTNYYITQIKNVTDALTEMDSDNADKYRENCAKYVEKVKKISERISSIKINSNEGVLIFHDAFAYLADEMGLKVADSIEIEGDNYALSAGEIAGIIDNMKNNNIKYIFVEKQYSTSIADSVAKATGATVYVVDSIVTGDDDKDAYINGMNSNIDIILSIMNNNEQ